MTFFWNVLQDHRFFKQRERADNLEARIVRLEEEMTELRDLLKKLLHEFETMTNRDIDGDGVVGDPGSLPLKEQLRRYRKEQQGK